ncbi:aldose epimerase family protein [Rhodobium gokarnense]|uniref:Aldose 1-epimerase n=1 Tax=Rhodobium gokarnense TaxID=364296 RepID=A0ABT3HHD8_9HYPH|nr:aldose epimerase family protein [Rhodobium gokarnense]MCW2309816.1 aldose 1-epimerase [Rhodobium gokarnense]
MTIETFGKTASGEDVEVITLAGGGLTVKLLTLGALVHDIRMDGIAHPLVLGMNSVAEYEAHARHFGVLAGRFANRIGGGRFRLDGIDYQLDRNENGVTHLHGGSAGFSDEVWEIVDADEDWATLTLISPRGAAGYPGRVEVIVVYRLNPGGVLDLDIVATSDAPTLMNVTTHSYFNLDGTDTIDGHRLEIAAESYTPVDDKMVPTGEVAPVAGTPYDFRQARALAGTRLDTNFCLADARRKDPQFAAKVTAGELAMSVMTTEPGLQVYTGEGVGPPVPGLDGRRYGPRGGLCLEPQVWPDAPNHEGFPSAVLRPGSVYRHITQYVFEKV